MTICVVGAGHVGLVTAACFAEMGHTVVCVDNDKARIQAIKRGKMPFYEPDMEKLVAKHLKKKLSFRTSLTAAIKTSEIIFIAVGTPPIAKRRGRFERRGDGGSHHRRNRPGVPSDC